MEEEKWEKIKSKVSNKFEWFCIKAIKDKKKGRAKGGIIMAVKKK